MNDNVVDANNDEEEEAMMTSTPRTDLLGGQRSVSFMARSSKLEEQHLGVKPKRMLNYCGSVCEQEPYPNVIKTLRPTKEFVAKLAAIFNARNGANTEEVKRSDDEDLARRIATNRQRIDEHNYVSRSVKCTAPQYN